MRIILILSIVLKRLTRLLLASYRALVDRDATIFQWLRGARIRRRLLNNVQFNAAIRPRLLDAGRINMVRGGLVGNTAIGKLHCRLLLQGCWDVGVKKWGAFLRKYFTDWQEIISLLPSRFTGCFGMNDLFLYLFIQKGRSTCQVVWVEIRLNCD